MKLSCDSIDLSDALTKVGRALPIKKVMPILNGIKIKAEGSSLTLTATDLELSIEKKIRADIKIEGETVVLGRYVTEYVRKIEDEEIIIDTTNENVMKLTFGENNFEVQTMEADEYPQFKNVDEDKSFYIIKKELKDLINKIIFCAASEDNRPTLKGCCLELNKNKITGVASDGYRLACCSKVIEYDGDNTKIIVPARSLSEISKLLDDEDETVKINIEQNYFMVDLNDTKIVTRLIEGEYINYNKIIPTEFSYRSHRRQEKPRRCNRPRIACHTRREKECCKA
jgi:DNA polymerase III, beta subunit